MKYKSTLNNNLVDSSYAILKGLSIDGGLFVPEFFPVLDYKSLKNMTYKEVALEILYLFFPEFSKEKLKEFIENAYNINNFETENIAEIKNFNPVFFLELYHGKTLAFKDFALSIFPYLLKYSAQIQGNKEKIVILTATSGDTGKAVLEAFSDIDGIEVIVFYPFDGVSYLQKLQMQTSSGKNLHVIGIEGNFDDAQKLVKDIFNNKEFNQKMKDKGFIFTSANSINIGRLIPQIIYYFYTYIKLLQDKMIIEDEKLNFVVPTGNFGNILACYYSKKMGLPIETIICASNENNVLYEFFTTARLNINKQFYKTLSPSMDILVSSNFERFLYDISSQDCELIKQYKENLRKGEFNLKSDIFNKLTGFYSSYATDQQTISAINRVYNNFSYLIDPHTAVAYKVYEDFLKFCDQFDCKSLKNTRTVVVSTASPFKFPKAILSAIGGFSFAVNRFSEIELAFILSQKTGVKLPKSIEQLKNMPILHNINIKKEQAIKFIEDIL